MNRFFLIALVISTIYGTIAAQDSSQVKLKAFVEGSIPDFDFLRNNISFVDFVNDPFESDVHIIVTSKSTGSGGEHYYISFNPVTIQSIDKLMLNCITSYQDTQDDVRFKFTEFIKSGLLVFTNEKQLYYQVKVVDDKSENNEQSLSSNTPNPWNNWVFNIRPAGGFEAEEQKKEYIYETALEASHYFPDFQYYALQTGAELSIRIAKGLFLEFGFEAERSNNQLYLPASELSDEDLLLNVRKLPTSFEVSGKFGIRYQFGSIYNNIVNQRL